MRVFYVSLTSGQLAGIVDFLSNGAFVSSSSGLTYISTFSGDLVLDGAGNLIDNFVMDASLTPVAPGTSFSLATDDGVFVSSGQPSLVGGIQLAQGDMPQDPPWWYPFFPPFFPNPILLPSPDPVCIAKCQGDYQACLDKARGWLMSRLGMAFFCGGIGLGTIIGCFQMCKGIPKCFIPCLTGVALIAIACLIFLLTINAIYNDMVDRCREDFHDCLNRCRPPVPKSCRVVPARTQLCPYY